MTKVSPEVEEDIQMETVLPVSADVSFVSDQFPKYKLGADNQILEEPKEDTDGPSLKEVVERETTQLSEQHKRLSVRDLASKFDKNLAAAAKLSEEVLCFWLLEILLPYNVALAQNPFILLIYLPIVCKKRQHYFLTSGKA